MYKYNGIPPLSTPNTVSSHSMAHGESNMSWESLSNSWIGFTIGWSC